jgi:hypothetical protein
MVEVDKFILHDRIGTFLLNFFFFTKSSVGLSFS